MGRGLSRRVAAPAAEGGCRPSGSCGCLSRRRRVALAERLMRVPVPAAEGVAGLFRQRGPRAPHEWLHRRRRAARASPYCWCHMPHTSGYPGGGGMRQASPSDSVRGVYIWRAAARGKAESIGGTCGESGSDYGASSLGLPQVPSGLAQKRLRSAAAGPRIRRGAVVTPGYGERR